MMFIKYVIIAFWSRWLLIAMVDTAEQVIDSSTNNLNKEMIENLIKNVDHLNVEICQMKIVLDKLNEKHHHQNPHHSECVFKPTEIINYNYHYHYYYATLPATETHNPKNSCLNRMGKSLSSFSKENGDVLKVKMSKLPNQQNNNETFTKEQKKSDLNLTISENKSSPIVLLPSVSYMNPPTTFQEYREELSASFPTFGPIDSSQKDNEIINDTNNTIMAICQMKPNRHIALLNQQNIQGLIYLRQPRHSNTTLLNIHIRLRGFKVDCEPNSTYDCAPMINSATTAPTLLNKFDENYSRAFGMHVHEGSDMTYDCQSVGNHYNPFNMTHGGPNDLVKHLGDLGNVYSDRFGRVNMDIQFANVSLIGAYGILNRTIVIHDGEDDYGKKPYPASKITGNSGVRIACCVIREYI